MLIAAIVFGPFLMAFVSYGIGRRQENARDIFVILVTFLELLLSLLLVRGEHSLQITGILNGGLWLQNQGLHTVYSLVTSLMWAGTTLFAREYFAHEREGLNRYWFFVLVTLGATQGVMLSSDLMTAFVFFEIVSFTSFTWVIHEETAEAIKAAYTYLFIAVIGGLVLFMGLALLQHCLGTLDFEDLAAAAARAEDPVLVRTAGVCILFGFGAKAGMFPVHVWLPKAHPVAPSPGSALLSGVLTKVGVYGILMTSLQALAGDAMFGRIVLILGTITMALGALMALFSVNLKRTLACSSMSQIGFILVGIAMYVLLTAAGDAEGAGVAYSGTVLHMVNHSLIKLTLFMCAGVVVMNLGALTLDDIRGWGRNKPFLKAAFALGALGISGVPFFNGYISKTMLHEGIVAGREYCGDISGMLGVIEWIFLFSGGLTFAYMLKLFICIFIEKHPEKQAEFDKDSRCMNTASAIAVCGSSLFMVLLGQPAVMNRLAAYVTGFHEILEFRPFILINLKGGAISLLIGACVYLLFVRKVLIRRGHYVNRWFRHFDLEDSVYRPLLLKVFPFVFGNLAAIPGENRILIPDSQVVFLLLATIGRTLCVSLDALVVLLRKTLLRETRVRGHQPLKAGRFLTLRFETARAIDPIVMNFSFALLMTCLGILMVLGVIMFFILV